MQFSKVFRKILLPIALLALLTGLWAGWIRIGWDFPFREIAAHHGAIMVGSFLGTLILLERVVAAKRKILLMLPLINVLSLLFFIIGSPDIAIMFLIAGGVSMTGLFIWFCVQHPVVFQFILLSGAAAYTAGNIVLFFTGSFPTTFPWWMAFFLLTIVGERLELTRYLNISFRKKMFLIFFLLIFVVGVIIPFHEGGRYIMAAGVTGSALWLLKYDMARKLVSKEGQFKFTGLILIFGYFWLLVTAAIAIFAHKFLFSFDAHLHAFFLGFVFSMIFAHAPIILPAVAGIAVKPYSTTLYIWVGLLQISLAARIIADLLELSFLRYWSGMFNGIAIIFFFINILLLIRAGSRVKS